MEKFNHVITLTDIADLPVATYIGMKGRFEYWRGYKTGIIYRIAAQKGGNEMEFIYLLILAFWVCGVGAYALITLEEQDVTNPFIVWISGGIVLSIFGAVFCSQLFSTF